MKILLIVLGLISLAFLQGCTKRDYLLVAATDYGDNDIDMRTGLHIDVIDGSMTQDVCRLKRDMLNASR